MNLDGETIRWLTGLVLTNLGLAVGAYFSLRERVKVLEAEYSEIKVKQTSLEARINAAAFDLDNFGELIGTVRAKERKLKQIRK